MYHETIYRPIPVMMMMSRIIWPQTALVRCRVVLPSFRFSCRWILRFFLVVAG
jgi:hypothetical protein